MAGGSEWERPFPNLPFIIARLLLCQTALARLLLCQTAVFLGLYAPRLPIFLCFCQTAAVWEIGQSGNLKRVVGQLNSKIRPTPPTTTNFTWHTWYVKWLEGAPGCRRGTLFAHDIFINDTKD